MIGAARRYRELFTGLLIERELEGGTLPEEIESHHVEELDRCWWAWKAPSSTNERAEGEKKTSFACGSHRCLGVWGLVAFA
jgi:hypothetical protein